jgi:hypothetical protein
MDHPGFEQVEPDVAGYVGDGGLAHVGLVPADDGLAAPAFRVAAGQLQRRVLQRRTLFSWQPTLAAIAATPSPS